MTRTTIRKSLIMGILLSMITVSKSQNTAEKIITPKKPTLSFDNLFTLSLSGRAIHK